MQTGKNVQLRNGFHIVVYYSVFFLLLTIAVFFPFLAEHRSLLWNPDAVVYHIPMAEVFADAVKIWFTEGTMASYDLSIGMGTDVLFYVSQWYMEPLNVLYAFFDAKQAEVLYGALIVVRLYLVGVAFLVFSGLMEKNVMPRVLGALVYVFSGYTLFTGTKAAPFLVAMILLPLILYATEKIWAGKSKVLFILLIAFSAIFSYYFLFMNSVLLAIYVLIAVAVKRMEICPAVRDIIKLIGYYLIGIALGGAVFLPAVAGFLGSSRSGGARNVKSFLHYDATYYQQLLTGIFHPQTAYDYWLVIGFTPFLAVALVVLFFKKDEVSRRLKAGWGILVVGACVPLFGCLMNAGKVSNNRWLYALVFVAALTICKTYAAVVEKLGKWIGKLLPAKAKMCAALLWCAALVLSIGIGGYHLFAESGEGYLEEFHKAGRGYKVMANNSNLSMIEIDDNGLYRVDNTKTPKLASSAWVIKDYRGLVTNASGYTSEMADFYRWFENAGVISSFRLSGMDNATILTTLAGVKYYTAQTEDVARIPYGYEHLKENIYRNKYALPFGYTYDCFVSKEQIENLTPTQKQEALLQAAIIEEDLSEELINSGLEELKPDEMMFHSQELPYKVIGNADVIVSDGGTEFKTEKEGAACEMLIQDIPGSGEVYIQWKGVTVWPQEVTAATVSFEEDGVGMSAISYQQKEATYSSGMDTYAANIGYSDKTERTVQLIFTQKATYRAEEIKVYYLPMDSYENSIKKLSQESFDITGWSDTEISAVASVSEKKLLCLPLVYSKGWHATVDGKKEEISKVNLMYCGLMIEEGEHEICFEYETPLGKEGRILSLIGILVFGGLLVYERKKGRIKNAE